MKGLIEQYRKLSLGLRNVLEITTICIALFLFVLLCQIGANGSVPALVLSLFIALLILGLEPYKNWQESRKLNRQYRYRVEKIEQQLAGRSRQDVLDAAPFEYSRWPDGDDCYVIFDPRTQKIVTSVLGTHEAELWILETTLAEEQ